MADTTIKSVRAHGYYKVEGNADSFGNIIRWSRDYDAEDIQQLLQVVPEILQGYPGDRLLLQVAADKTLFAPTELNLAIKRRDSLIQSLLFWLPLLNRLSGKGEEQRLRITLDNAREEPGLYLKNLPGAIDLQHSFMINASGNRVSLSVGNPEETRANGEALTALTFLEIRSEPCYEPSSEDSQNTLPLSDDELKKSLGQDDLLLTGSGGSGYGGDFKPDHRPGRGGGNGAPTENMLMISMALSLTGHTRKENNHQTLFSPRGQQHSVLVQSISPDGLVIREQIFSLEQIMGSVTASQSLTAESKELARQLTRNAVRIQTYGDPVQALKNLILAEPPSGCLPGEIPDMISCPVGGKKKSQGESRSSGDGQKSGAKGTGGASPWSGSGSRGGSASGSGSGGDGRQPRENSGRKPELTSLSDDKGEEEKKQQRHIDHEVKRWNAGSFSERIGWEQIYPYLPQKGLDIIRFLELVSSADKHTYDRLALLIQQTAVVQDHPDEMRKLLAYKYLRAGLKNFYSNTEAKIDCGVALTRSEQETHAVLSESFVPASVSFDIDKVSPLAPYDINWNHQVLFLARTVFTNVESDDELMSQSTANSEKDIRDYIYEFIANKSGRRHEKILIRGLEGKRAIRVGDLVSKLESLGVENNEVLTALAARGNFVANPEIVPEPEITEKIKAFLLRKWRKLGPWDQSMRRALAKFSIMVMSDNFLSSPLPNPGMDTKLSLDQLRSLPSEGKTINVIGLIASEYRALGKLLLGEYDGSQLRLLEMAHSYQAKPIMTAIFEKWLVKESNPTWRELVNAIKRLGRGSLADQIEQALKR